MTYLTSSVDSRTALKSDVYYQDDYNTAYQAIHYVNISTPNTQAALQAVGADYINIRLPMTTSSYYLEASVGVRDFNRNGTTEWQFFDVDTGQWIGQSGFMNTVTSFGTSARQGRRVSRALVLSSEATVSVKTVRVRIQSKPSSYTFEQTSTGFALIAFAGAASLRIIEIPN
jgi:hypothetical protein